MKFSYIIIDDNKVMVEQIINKEKGIKFFLNEKISGYFHFSSNKSIHTDKLIIGRNNKNITLLDCFYTIRNNLDGRLYVHLIYNEYTNCIVHSRNFIANKLVVSLNKEKINESIFNKVSFTFDNYRIRYSVKKNSIDIIVSAKTKSNRYDLFNIFTYNFELLNIILGFFPIIIKSVYYDEKNRIVLNQKYVDKYYTNIEYIKSDLCFFDKIDTDLIKGCFQEYIIFSETNKMHIDTYFLSLMKKSSYIDVRTVNILHSLDGMYDKLKIYSNQVEEYPYEMNVKIIEKLKEIDISDIQKEYNTNINISSKIDNIFKRAYLYGYRNKLKKLFSFDSYIVFENEKNKKIPMNFNSLIEKCINTRNGHSHADEHEELSYLNSTECISYFFKLILLYRLQIMNQLGIYSKINKENLKNHISNLDRYINRLKKEDISDIVFKHIGMRKFDISLVVPIENAKNKSCQYKPVNGGYWASPENSENNWENTRAIDESSKSHYCRFKIKEWARIKYIFENIDLYYCPHIDKNNIKSLDFEKMCDEFDVIYYYPEKEDLPNLLPFWECDCILVLNTDVMDIIENI